MNTSSNAARSGACRSARGYFSITTPACLELTKNTDSDGDGIMNAWETPGRGLDVNNDGTVDLSLGDAPYNVTPWRKDLFVEADWMTGHRPDGDVIPDVVKAFNEAPVDPEGNSGTDFLGINLHAGLDEEVPNVAGLLFQTDGGGTLDDFNDIKRGNPTRGVAGRGARMRGRRPPAVTRRTCCSRCCTCPTARSRRASTRLRPASRRRSWDH